MTSINKKIINASPLEFDGIKFRSKLELYCYKKLKENNINFKYEKYTYNLIPTFKYKSDLYESYKKNGKWLFGQRETSVRAMTYMPDFVNEDDKWIIECKGFPNDAFPIRWKLFKYLLTKLDLSYDLYLPKNQSHVDECINLIIEKNARKRLL